MLTRLIATIAALALIGLAALAAALPAAAQSGGDSSGADAAAPTATATPTATPDPGPTSFALKPHIKTLVPRGLARMGNKWYVGGHSSGGYVYIFNDGGAYERRIKRPNGNLRGLTADGTNLIAVIKPNSTTHARLYKWAPQANDSLAASPTLNVGAPTPSSGGRYGAQGIAYDGTNLWAALPTGGEPRVLKLNAATGAEIATYRMDAQVDSLAYENGYLYGVLDDDAKKHLVRVSPSALNAASVNYWKVVRRDVEIRDGLAFRNGVAYGFNIAQNEVRQARRPSPERLFSVTPRIWNQQTRSLTRMGNKWYVGGHSAGGYIHIFNDDGTPSSPSSIKTTGPQMPLIARGLTSVGADLVAISGSQPRVYKWTPQTDSTTEITVPNASGALNLPNYAGQGLAYDGTHVWAALQPRANAQGGASLLIKLNAATLATIATYRINRAVDSLAYENGYLYGVLDDPDNKHLVRVSPSTLNAASTNYWKLARLDVGIRDGLVFRNGVAYGFNAAQDEIRRARQPSPEQLFALAPHWVNWNMQPRGLARVGDKWHIAGHSGDGYVYIFSNTGTYERRIRKPAFSVRGLASDGTNLFAAAVTIAEAVTFGDNTRVRVRVPHIYKWTPQADETTPVSAIPFCIPNALGHTPNGVAYDGTHIWAALDSPSRNILVKLNATTGAHVGTYRMNNAVSGLTYKNGNLYALSDGNIVMAVASHLKMSPATWVNSWEVVKRDSGLSHGLVFRDRTAYGFNQLHDELRAESGDPTIAASPASPAGVTLPTGSIPPTGAVPSDAAAPAPTGTSPAPDPAGSSS